MYEKLMNKKSYKQDEDIPMVPAANLPELKQEARLPEKETILSFLVAQQLYNLNLSVPT